MIDHAIARPLLAARALRALIDGAVAVLLPVYLLSLGLTPVAIGVLLTTTLVGSALATLAVGAFGHRWPLHRWLAGAALLMAATGLAFAGITDYWPLLAVAFVGTLNPSSGDVSLFLPLEHAALAGAAEGSAARTTLFARYSLAGALFAALGALAAGLPDWTAARFGVERQAALRAMFIAYAAVGALVWLLYRRLPRATPDPAAPARPAPLTESRATVVKLAALFSVDAFGGGFVVNSMLSLWLIARFGLGTAEAGQFFFATGLLGAASQLAAPKIAARIGLVNTMVFTHLPANACLVLAAVAPTLPLALTLLCVRSAFMQMDVPTRSAYVMGVVTPAERPAAASFTAVPRSLAAALSPSLAGLLLAGGWLAAPLVASGLLKIGYDLALWRAFRRHPPRDE